MNQKIVELFKTTKIKAEKGDAKAQFCLGAMYFCGDGVQQDYMEAVKWWRKAAEKGDAKAQSCVGNMYSGGLGVPEDDVEAVKWRRKAAEQGHAKAQTNLGEMYYEGSKGVPKDYVEAAKWYRKAAAQGDADAQYSLGWMYWNGEGVPRDDLVALQWTQNAAEQGLDEARTFLKRMHEFVVTEMKAEKGDPKAKFEFGLMCHNSEVAPQGYKDDADYWILDAAEGGCDDALSLMIDTSEGDKHMFLYWIEKGVKQRKGWVQFVRGEIYEEGEVVLKNFIEAYAWFLVAKANGTEHAEEKISDLEKRLTAEGIEKGQARAAELQRSFGAE